MQVAGEAGALVLARGLQVAGQLGELGGAARHLDLQPVALGAHFLRLLGALVVERAALAHEQHEHDQAQQRHAGHADAAEHQRVVDLAGAQRDAAVLVGQQLGRATADLLHLVAADVGHHELPAGRLAPALVELEHLLQLAELGTDGAGDLLAAALGILGAHLRVHPLQRAEALRGVLRGEAVGVEVFRPAGDQVSPLP